jgi:hypothetical protein
MSWDALNPDWDTPQWRELRDQRLIRWLRDPDAVACVLTLSGIAEVWDDIIDNDNPAPARVNRAFTDALVSLQFNPFYTRHQNMILPVVVVGINAWLDANELEGGDTNQRMQAFYLRNYSYEVASIIAACALGWDGLRAVSLEMRSFFSHETYQEWEHRHDG